MRVSDCALFASDSVAIERAESAARELSKRLAVWRGAEADHVWRDQERDRIKWTVSNLRQHVVDCDLGIPAAFGSVLMALERAAELHGRGTDLVAAVQLPPRTSSVEIPQPLRTAIALFQQWQFAVACDWAVPEDFKYGEVVLADGTIERVPLAGGKRFAEMEAPFEPLFALWSTGYTALRLDTIPSATVLLAPGLPLWRHTPRK